MRKFYSLAIALLLLSSISAQTKAALPVYNVSANKLALEGYDPVSYFTKNQAVKGQASVTATYHGVLYRFENQTNKNAFLSNPAAYEPRYGGWCAYAMGATGEKVEVDPGTFKIVNGKLYLFYNRFFNNTLKSWNKDEAVLMKKADANWSAFISSTKNQ